MKIDFVPVTEVAFEVAECPIYDERTKAVYFIDIIARDIHRLSIPDHSLRTFHMHDVVGSIGLAESGRLVVACDRTVGLFDTATGSWTPIASVETDNPDVRLNDGRVGPDGAFWAGTVHEPRWLREPWIHLKLDQATSPVREAIGNLYRFAPDGAVTWIAGGYMASNGLAFSPDGRIMYHSDSAVGRIDRWTLDPATGKATDRRLFATANEEQGRPDGAAMDSNGHYWSGGVSAAVLNRFSPDGKLAESFPTPVAAPTMPCFSGPDLRTLYVMSLMRRPKEMLAQYPLTGRVIVGRAPVAGIPEFRFKDV